ncbi:MAG: flavodoxin domain-containing protein, partial [Duncaniella sp.]|nr:flavodoxin domain-containing protein [Duncaniella sp.]
TGTTAEVAKEIGRQLKVEDKDIHDVAETAPSAVGDYDVLILGSSTWGDGDLQEDMATFLDGLQSLDLREKEVAIFGCGDDNMKDTFCNAVGEIYHKLHDAHPMFIAPFNNLPYTYSHSGADVEGMIVGLCLDQTNHADETPARIKTWVEEIKKEL